MKKSVIVYLVFLLSNNLLYSQNLQGVSKNGSLYLTKEPPKPPLLEVVKNSLTFSDADGNNCIDADEKTFIIFELVNNGQGDGVNLIAKLKETNGISGLKFAEDQVLGTIQKGSKMTVKLPIEGTMKLTTGTANFNIKINEAHGFGLDAFQMEVRTKAFQNPIIKIADWTLTSDKSSKLQKKKPFDVQVLIQNTGQGKAEDVKISLLIPENTVCYSGNTFNNLGIMQPNEKKIINYSLIVNEIYNDSVIPLSLKAEEYYKQYGDIRTIKLTLNQDMSTNKVVVESKASDKPIEIQPGTLTSDVDRNIPETKGIIIKSYALIIGNEDYSSFQKGLTKEQDVDYATNDAISFKEYAVKTLGVPEKQITLIQNGSLGQINQGIAWLNNLIKLEKGDAEVYFYYSGHGLPDEETKEAYIIPVDVNGGNVKEGVKLNDVYAKLTEYPSKKVTVFLDACFSGGSRNKGLLSMKGVRIKPKENIIKGNMVIITSSSGEESSGVYREKQHGFMTYFLLKKLQETNGVVAYKDLSEYIIRNVTKESGLISKPQTPQVLYSPEVEGKWEKWKINE